MAPSIGTVSARARRAGNMAEPAWPLQGDVPSWASTLSIVIAPAMAAAVVLTRVPFIRMRAEVLPAPPMMGATFTHDFCHVCRACNRRDSHCVEERAAHGAENRVRDVLDRQVGGEISEAGVHLAVLTAPRRKAGEHRGEVSPKPAFVFNKRFCKAWRRRPPWGYRHRWPRRPFG